MSTDSNSPPSLVSLRYADELRKAGDTHRAIELYLSLAGTAEIPESSLCLKLARSYQQMGDLGEARRWAVRVVDAGEDFTAWQAAADIVERCAIPDSEGKLRSVRIAVVGSYTTKHLVTLLRLIGLRYRMCMDIYESEYGQYRQEIIDSNSGMYKFKPDLVLLAVHEGELALPDYTASPEEAVEAEMRRWLDLWNAIAGRCQARIVQYNFVLPAEAPMGHLSSRLAGCRYAMTQSVNAKLGSAAGSNASIVDCERLASAYGKIRWIDPRYWYLAKQGVALGALPSLVRHTAAVIAADLGLSRKCLVLDLDNTLWGGVIGEDGMAGIQLGNGVDGEAYVAFQEYILKLKNKGVVLAVCSKNNEDTAKEPFERHPEMRLQLNDIAVFVANWRPKAENIRTIAKILNLGLDAFAFVDDDTVERAAMRELVPEVDVISLPQDPAQYTRALSDYLMFETSAFVPEDGARTDLYRAMAQVGELEASSTTIEEFYRNLHMQAIVAPFDDFHLPRIAQLIGKTNQFNLTNRRYGMGQLRALMDDPDCVHFFLRLRDRFADHGLVCLMIALRRDNVLEVDTWLMSCRVIGRTVEAEMLKQLCERALDLGCHSLRGVYLRSSKNSMVQDIYGKYGFDLVEENDGVLTWNYDIRTKGPLANDFINVVQAWENANDAA